MVADRLALLMVLTSALAMNLGARPNPSPPTATASVTAQSAVFAEGRVVAARFVAASGGNCPNGGCDG